MFYYQQHYHTNEMKTRSQVMEVMGENVIGMDKDSYIRTFLAKKKNRNQYGISYRVKGQQRLVGEAK